MAEQESDIGHQRRANPDALIGNQTKESSVPSTMHLEENFNSSGCP